MLAAILGTGILALITTFLLLWIIAILAIYIYSALAWMTIGEKLKYRYPWLAWIPIANKAMILQLGGFHWAWIFLIAIPVAGWIALFVLCIIALWHIYEKRKYPGWLSLFSVFCFVPFVAFAALIATLIIWGFVAWYDKK